jgi:hypothetical protein
VSFVRNFYNEMVPLVRHSRQGPNNVAKMVLSYKNYRWLYEREWRMFAPLGKTYFADKTCVTRVYLGSRIDPAKHQKIIKAMDALDIETHDMKIEKYSMTFEPCSRVKTRSQSVLLNSNSVYLIEVHVIIAPVVESPDIKASCFSFWLWPIEPSLPYSQVPFSPPG